MAVVEIGSDAIKVVIAHVEGSRLDPISLGTCLSQEIVVSTVP